MHLMQAQAYKQCQRLSKPFTELALTLPEGRQEEDSP
jgi:hypothetical protein